MNNNFHLKVVTPKGPALEEDVLYALLPDERGFVGVLTNHAPFVISSPGGKMVLRLKDGQEKTYQIGAGFFEVAHNQAVFLAQSFQGV
ncbi:MAG: F0F1 ATP synthase subunit epsilon [Candidatus Omnitrophica bacterium]|nr:F0F1 ATP synthase subunit epsilon [Candidatus Omnitrophota bacterium]